MSNGQDESYRESEVFVEDGVDICVDSGMVRNWGPWIGALIIVGGVGLLVTERDDLSLFGGGLITLGAIVYIFSVWDRVSGVRDREFLFNNPILKSKSK